MGEMDTDTIGLIVPSPASLQFCCNQTGAAQGQPRCAGRQMKSAVRLCCGTAGFRRVREIEGSHHSLALHHNIGVVIVISCSVFCIADTPIGIVRRCAGFPHLLGQAAF